MARLECWHLPPEGNVWSYWVKPKLLLIDTEESGEVRNVERLFKTVVGNPQGRACNEKGSSNQSMALCGLLFLDFLWFGSLLFSFFLLEWVFYCLPLYCLAISSELKLLSPEKRGESLRKLTQGPRNSNGGKVHKATSLNRYTVNSGRPKSNYPIRTIVSPVGSSSPPWTSS